MERTQSRTRFFGIREPVGGSPPLEPGRVAAVARADAAVDLDDPVGDPVEEVAVVRDRDDGAANSSIAVSSTSTDSMSRWFVGSSSTSRFGRASISSSSWSRVRSPPDSSRFARRTCSYGNRNFISSETASPSDTGTARRTVSSGVEAGSSVSWSWAR